MDKKKLVGHGFGYKFIPVDTVSLISADIYGTDMKSGIHIRIFDYSLT
jgi:hypothetical protein